MPKRLSSRALSRRRDRVQALPESTSQRPIEGRGLATYKPRQSSFGLSNTSLIVSVFARLQSQLKQAGAWTRHGQEPAADCSQEATMSSSSSADRAAEPIWLRISRSGAAPSTCLSSMHSDRGWVTRQRSHPKHSLPAVFQNLVLDGVPVVSAFPGLPTGVQGVRAAPPIPSQRRPVRRGEGRRTQSADEVLCEGRFDPDLSVERRGSSTVPAERPAQWRASGATRAAVLRQGVTTSCGGLAPSRDWRPVQPPEEVTTATEMRSSPASSACTAAVIVISTQPGEVGRVTEPMAAPP